MGKKNKKNKKVNDFTAEIFTADDFLDASDCDSEEVETEEFDNEELIDEEMDDDIEILEENFDGEDEEEYEEEQNRRKGWKIALIVIAGIIVAAYAGVSVYFMNHFYPYTVLNGVDVSMYTVEQVEEIQEKEAQEYNIKLLESDDDITLIKGSDIAVVYEKDGKVKELLKSQNAFLWAACFFKDPIINAPVSVSYDKAKLNKVIDNMKCMKPEEQVESISAHPVVQGKEFVVVDEQIGTQIDREKFVAAVEGAIADFASELDLVEADVYHHAKYNVDSPEVVKACEEMNTYLGAEITLNFTPFTEVVDASVIGTFVHFDENMAVSFSEEAVRAYVASLSEKYDTVGKTRQFVTGYGNTVEVTGGDFGWQLDQETEYATLLANIQNKEVVTRDPAYLKTALTHEGYDFGTTYVEVDLTNQHMFFFQGGQLVLESDIVTGNPNAGNATPQGVYAIAYKQMHVNLRGPKKEDGTYEWDSPVTYWMPFNGGIGLHDAPWQSAFGGTRYTWAGSHGCVNLPWATADALYPLVDAGTPVVCHY